MANNVDPDQMPHSVASDLGLHCLLRLSCPNTLGNYGTNFVWIYSKGRDQTVQSDLDGRCLHMP